MSWFRIAGGFLRDSSDARDRIQPHHFFQLLCLYHCLSFLSFCLLMRRPSSSSSSSSCSSLSLLSSFFHPLIPSFFLLPFIMISITIIYLYIYIHIFFFFDFFHLPFSSHSICCCSIDAISFIMQSFRFRLCFWGFCLVSSFCFKKEKEKEKKKEKLAQRIYRKIFWPAARLLSAIQKREREKDLPRQRRSIWSCLLCVDGSCRCQLMSAHRRQHRS